MKAKAEMERIKDALNKKFGIEAVVKDMKPYDEDDLVITDTPELDQLSNPLVIYIAHENIYVTGWDNNLGFNTRTNPKYDKFEWKSADEVIEAIEAWEV